jgi:hypothetical protein
MVAPSVTKKPPIGGAAGGDVFPHNTAELG